MEHVSRHSHMRQQRTWCSLVWTISKHATNMLWICSAAELYCRGTNQKLSVFWANIKTFLVAVWTVFVSVRVYKHQMNVLSSIYVHNFIIIFQNVFTFLSQYIFGYTGDLYFLHVFFNLSFPLQVESYDYKK